MRKNESLDEEEMDELSQCLNDLQQALLIHDHDATGIAKNGVQEKLLGDIKILMSQFFTEAKSKLFCYWNNLMQMILILMQYIRAEREQLEQPSAMCGTNDTIFSTLLT